MSPRKQTSKKSGAGAALLCLFGAAGAAQAQNVLLSPQPTYSATPSAVQDEMDQGMGTLREGFNPTAPDLAQFLNWGPVTVHPHFSYQISYGDGIQSAPGQPQTSLVQNLSPGVLFAIGTHWTVDYEPSLIFFSSGALRNYVDQTGSISWGTAFEDWTFGFSQGFNASDSPNVQTGSQLTTQSYSTSLTVSHRLGSQISTDTTVTQSISETTQQFSSSASWNVSEFLNYEIYPRLDAGIGIGFSYSTVSLGSDLLNENVNARLSWRVANKTSLVASVGFEEVEYIGGGVPNTLTPVYGLSLNYVPFHQTTISLSGNRSVSPSYLASQAIESSTISLTVSQRLLKRLNFSVTGSYGFSDYIASTAGVASSRSDSYYSISSQLSWAFLKHATASLTYGYSANNSSANGFTYASTQAGAQLAYGF